MPQLKKLLLVASIGFVFASAGVLLRLNAKALSMQTSAPTKVIGAGGKSLRGSISFSFENTSRTAALTDIGMVLLSVGAALFVIAAATWLFLPNLPGVSVPLWSRFKQHWPFWDARKSKGAAVASPFTPPLDGNASSVRDCVISS
jgi:hypothetical protein